MALDLGRWWKYAQAKLSSAAASGNEELDRLEAERAAELADRPWLAADGEAPTIDEARARIEWEAAHAQPTASAGSAAEPAASTGAADDAEVAAARLELDRQARESTKRLEAIRAELGVDPPTEGG